MKQGTKVIATESIRDIQEGDTGIVVTEIKNLVGVHWDRIGFAAINKNRIKEVSK